jgi:DNA topoisomerase-3
MTLKYNGNSVLSIGRVQTPTLNMLVERELAIRNFKSEKYYTIEGTFETAKGETYTGDHSAKKFKDKAEAESIVNKITGKQGIVEKVEKKTTTKKAPPLYNLSSLQMAANSQFGFTIAKTLDIAQELYEGGFTTYPRTDSQYLTEDMEPVVNKTLNMLETLPEYKDFIKGKARKFNKKKYFDDSKVSSHFAIIPTLNKPDGLTSDQQKVYDLIARSVIMMIYERAKVERTSIVTNVDGEKFTTSGSTIVEKNWMEVGGLPKEKILPVLKEGETVNGTYKFLEKNTEPPKSYTDKTLLSAMVSAGKDLDDEELKKVMDSGVKGIGTEATRAAIIETLIKRGYAIRDKKSIKATDKGISLIQALPLKEIKSAELTAMWENRLNNIALKKEDFDTFVNDIEDLTRKWCNEITTATKSEFNGNTSGESFTCPLCGKPVTKKSWGWGCSCRPEKLCRWSL